MMLIKTCPFCGKTTTLTNVDKDAYEAWENGELIQNAFPMSTPMEREVIKTGMCAACQNQIFGSDDDDDGDLVAQEFDLGGEGELWEEEFDNWDDEVGFDPYEGCYTFNC